MTPPTTKLVAMTADHVERAKRWVIAVDSDFDFLPREILANVSSQSSGETVAIRRDEIEALRSVLREEPDPSRRDKIANSIVSGWLS